MPENVLGRIVLSKSGRDKGRLFVVLKVFNERYVIIADGDYRKVEKPKLKNVKHLQWTNITAESILNCLKQGEFPENHMIRKALEDINKSRFIEGKEVW